MSRTHHSAPSYRLSCNCIVQYSSVSEAGSLSPRYRVLCPGCGESASVLRRYPDEQSSCGATCRADSPSGGVIRVKCTEGKRHAGRHFDCTVEIRFDLPRRLRSGKQGNT